MIFIGATRLATFTVNDPLDIVAGFLSMGNYPDDDGAYPWLLREPINVLPSNFMDPEYYEPVSIVWNRHDRTPGYCIDFNASFYVGDRHHGIHVGSGPPATVRLVAVSQACTEIRIIWSPMFRDCPDLKAKLLRIRDRLLVRWTEEPVHGATPALRTGREEMGLTDKGGPSDTTQARAAVFRRLKDAHPEWGRVKVAADAMQDREWIDSNLGVANEDTVRNAYKAMRWEWKRGERSR